MTLQQFFQIDYKIVNKKPCKSFIGSSSLIDGDSKRSSVSFLKQRSVPSLLNISE